MKVYHLFVQCDFASHMEQGNWSIWYPLYTTGHVKGGDPFLVTMFISKQDFIKYGPTNYV